MKKSFTERLCKTEKLKAEKFLGMRTKIFFIQTVMFSVHHKPLLWMLLKCVLMALYDNTYTSFWNVMLQQGLI